MPTQKEDLESIYDILEAHLKEAQVKIADLVIFLRGSPANKHKGQIKDKNYEKAGIRSRVGKHILDLTVVQNAIGYTLNKMADNFLKISSSCGNDKYAMEEKILSIAKQLNDSKPLLSKFIELFSFIKCKNFREADGACIRKGGCQEENVKKSAPCVFGDPVRQSTCQCFIPSSKENSSTLYKRKVTGTGRLLVFLNWDKFARSFFLTLKFKRNGQDIEYYKSSEPKMLRTLEKIDAKDPRGKDSLTTILRTTKLSVNGKRPIEVDSLKFRGYDRNKDQESEDVNKKEKDKSEKTQLELF